MDDREQGQKAAEAAMGGNPWQELDEAATLADELFVGWCDASMDAGHWVRLAGLEPLEAAMLLCRLNPNEEIQETAEWSSSDCTDGTDFKRLLSLFKDAGRTDQSPRTLADWLSIAKDRGAKHHPWLGRYLDIIMPVRAAAGARAPLAADLAVGPRLSMPGGTSTSPAPSSKPNEQRSLPSQRTATQEALRRRDLINPIIEQAQGACSDPTSIAQVFAEMRRLASLKQPPIPLVGVDEGGIHWIDADDRTRVLSRKSLGDRLRRWR